jgi:hypothetical protein
MATKSNRVLRFSGPPAPLLLQVGLKLIFQRHGSHGSV